MPNHSNAQSQLAGPLTEFLFEQLTQRAKRPIAELAKLAIVLRSAHQQLDGNIGSAYLQRGAERLEQVAELLRAEPEDAVRTLREFARAQPLTFVGGAFLAGIGGARFFKSSAHTRMEVQAEGSAPAESSARPAGSARSRSRQSEPRKIPETTNQKADAPQRRNA